MGSTPAEQTSAMTSASDVLSEATGVSHAYGSLTIVQALSLHVRAAECLVIMAPSGAGKSTLLRLLLGLETPRVGTCKLFVPTTDIGVAFQEEPVFPWLTVQENVSVVAKVSGRHIDPAQVNEQLDALGLTPWRDEFPRRLSTGMKQKVALGRLLVMAPRMYVIDESMANIDDLSRFSICDELRRRVVGGASILAITHNPTDALHLGDRILVGTTRPLTISRTIENPLRRDRNYRARFTREFESALEELRTCEEH
jgi:NitT/TauT family transport system ATP-binding protein